MPRVRLDRFVRNTQLSGKTIFVRLLWYFLGRLFIGSHLFPLVRGKCSLLRLFGAKIGKGVVIKPNVNIKYPWYLSIGDHTWIGENVWIDNLNYVHIGSSVCISQGAMLLCGNHDYKSSKFDLLTEPITIEDGAWIGAKSVVCPGIKVRTHAVLAVGSIATKDLEAYKIYQGNPAQLIRQRSIV